MLVDLKRRFQFVTDPAAPNFDPVYVASTLLSPPYRKFLNSAQEVKAKYFLLELMISNRTDHEGQLPQPMELESSNTLGSSSSDQFDNAADGNYEQSQEAEELPTKRFKHLDRVSKLLEREELDDQESDEMQISKEEHQLNDYMKIKANSEDRRLDPFDYWVKRKEQFPSLSTVACDILATPASTAPVERIFSSGGEVTRGKRNRLTDKNLEREIFLRRNKKYID